MAHGRDHYRSQAGQALSYFIRVQTLEGRRTFWGKGLDAALDKALRYGFFVVECPITFYQRVGVSKGGNASNARA
jgi:hypothetical protein